MVNMQTLIDDARCFESIRSMRWPDGVRCPGCGRAEVTRDDPLRDPTPSPALPVPRLSQAVRRPDRDDLRRPPPGLRVRVQCLSFMRANVSNEHISEELGIDLETPR